jgi:hypothetical protein
MPSIHTDTPAKVQDTITLLNSVLSIQDLSLQQPTNLNTVSMSCTAQFNALAHSILHLKSLQKCVAEVNFSSMAVPAALRATTPTHQQLAALQVV